MFSVKKSFPWMSNQALILNAMLLAIPCLLYFHAQPHIEMAILGFVCSTILLHFSIRRGYFYALAPITWIILSSFLTTVVGATLMWYGISYRFGGSGEILLGVLKVQTYGIVALISIFSGYSLIYSKKLNSLYLSSKNKEFLFLIFKISLIYAFVLQISSVFIFQMNRYELEIPSRAYHAINAFQKLSLFWFFLIPLFINRGKLFKIFISFIAFAYWIFLATSGSRSAIFFPVLYCLVGLYFFSNKVVKIENWGKVFLIIPLISFPLAEYRDSNYFRSTKPTEIIKRVSGFFDKKKYQEYDWDWHGKVQLAGQSLNGTNDYLLYEKYLSRNDYVGFENISRLSQLYVPSFVNPQKESLLDMDEIVREITNDPSVHGSSISFMGDLFRRFGLVGVVGGSFIIGLFLKIVEINLLKINNVFYLLYNFMFILYFPGMPFRSFLESIWIWLYEIPKYCTVFLIIYIVYSFYCKVNKVIKY
jgi:hypothetical protein